MSTQTELYGTPFPFCLDHLTIVLLESAVHDNRHIQLLKHYLGGNVDQSKETWMLLSNYPKGCRLNKCYNISPNFDYCSAKCKHQHVAEQAEEQRALAEQAEVEQRALSKQAEVKRAPAEQKKKRKLYHIGTGDGIGKSVRFWVNEETITIGYALGQQSIKLADVVFHTSRRQDECNYDGRKNHWHSIKCAKQLLDVRLKKIAKVYAMGLTPKRKQLTSKVDKELFSSTIARFTLLISHIVQTSGLEVRECLDKTLDGVVLIGQWATLWRVGQYHSGWKKALKQLATDNRSFTPSKPVITVCTIMHSTDGNS